MTQQVGGNSEQQVAGKRDGGGRLAVLCVRMCGQPWFKRGDQDQRADTDERFQRGVVVAACFF